MLEDAPQVTRDVLAMAAPGYVLEMEDVIPIPESSGALSASAVPKSVLEGAPQVPQDVQEDGPQTPRGVLAVMVFHWGEYLFWELLAPILGFWAAGWLLWGFQVVPQSLWSVAKLVAGKALFLWGQAVLRRAQACSPAVVAAPQAPKDVQGMSVQNNLLEMEAIPIPVYTGASGLSVAPQDVLEPAPLLPRFALGNELQMGLSGVGRCDSLPRVPPGP